jgi:NAD(P)-dependent dehydrogenase (short-subunit alcohol dehydrogenase family)
MIRSWRRVRILPLVRYALAILTNISNKGIPLGRFGRPDEIAETVVWMVKTGYVTNKVVGVDGGWFPQ